MKNGQSRIRIARTKTEITRCFAVMAELRPHLIEREFFRRIRRQQRQGRYELAFLEDAGAVRAVAGFRVAECLWSGKFFYVDDLVTASGANFLGTTDNQPLEIKANGACALRLEPHSAGRSSLIGGYSQNSAAGAAGAAIAGGGTSGAINSVLGNYGFVGAGIGARAGGQAAVVGGAYNSALGQYSFVGTGLDNTNLGNASVIGGGSKNLVMAPGENAVIGGGVQNTADNQYAVIGGGELNVASTFSTIGGGRANRTSGAYATVAGGRDNQSMGLYSSVGGGQGNASGGDHATVPGGLRNSANGPVSFAAGTRAKANHQGAFVWADSQDADFNSTGNDEFSVRATGGVRMVGKGLVSTGTDNGVQGNSSNPNASGVYGENSGEGFGIAGRSGGRGTAVLGENLDVNGYAGYFRGRTQVDGSLDIGGRLGVDGILALSDHRSPNLNAGVVTEDLTRLVNLGINDDSVNRFGGAFSAGAQGGFFRVDARFGEPLFGFFGRPAGVNGLVKRLGSITSDGTVRFELGTGQRLSLGGLGTFEVDAPFLPAGRFVITDNGRVGIGSPDPQSKLAVVNSGAALVGTALSSTLVTSAGDLPVTQGAEIALASFGLTTRNNTSLGVRARRTSAGNGWQQVALGLTFDVDDTVQAGGGLWLAPGRFVGEGYVGIGTANPAAKLDVADGDILLSSGRTLRSSGRLHIQSDEDLFLNPWGGTSHVGGGGGPGNLVVHGSLHAQGVGLPGNSGPDPNLVGTPGNYIAFGHSGVSEDFIGYRNNTFFFKDSPGGADTCDPTVEIPVLRITGGCDLAEPFKMSHADIPQGAVVIIDDEHPGQLKISEGAYDTRVAGIVSGANGVKAGITLHQEGLIEGGQNVALSGRVYVQADASGHPIKPGDLLTTSDTPGHAMRVVDHAKGQGAILGKAMTGLKEGKGMVLVLVSLQ